MNTKSTAPMRVCTRCHVPKPQTKEHYFVRTYYESGHKAFTSICKPCNRLKDKERAEKHSNTKATRPAPRRSVIRICEQCGGLPWRVPGIKCPGCNRRHAAEPKAELQLRRHFERAV